MRPAQGGLGLEPRMRRSKPVPGKAGKIRAYKGQLGSQRSSQVLYQVGTYRPMSSG